MNLQDYLRAAEVEQPLPRPVLELFEEPRATDLTEPLSQHRPALRLAEFDDIVNLVLARHRWLAVGTAIETVGQALTQEQAAKTLLPDEVPALVAALRDGADDAQSDALFALYQACMAAALETSTMAAAPAKKNHPRAAQYAPYVADAKPLAEIEAATWFVLRRGEKAGALALTLAHDIDAIVLAAAEPLEALAELMGKTKPAEFVTTRVLADFQESLLGRKALLCEEALLRKAATDYQALLLAEPTKLLPLGAVFIGSDKQRIGMAALDKRGAVAATAPIRPSSGWTDRVLRWMRDHKAKVIAIPDSALASGWLIELKAALEEGRPPPVEVSVTGIIVARSIDDPALKRVSPEIASAIVLARRAHRPIDEWTRVDPTKLNLMPFQNDLDEGRVREVLQAARERAIADGQPLSTAPVTTGGIRARASAPLNPTITGLRDLRPGLSLNGVITNVTKFGAFVNIGLRQEGLVHISELSDEFVNEPAEVVQPGQRVSVRVISVDLDRGRIALSMRTENAPMRRPPMGGGGGGGRGGPPRSGGGPPRGGGRGMGERGGNATGADRSRALGALEDLFKKPD